MHTECIPQTNTSKNPNPVDDISEIFRHSFLRLSHGCGCAASANRLPSVEFYESEQITPTKLPTFPFTRQKPETIETGQKKNKFHSHSRFSHQAEHRHLDSLTHTHTHIPIHVQ